MNVCILFVVISQQLSPTPEVTQPVRKALSPDVQRDGIRAAVVNLESQIKQLAKDSNRDPRLKNDQPNDQQDAVMQLADSMADNLLLTRTYLALAVAELKYCTLPCCAQCTSKEEKQQFLRHVEAIQLAIDDRILDPQDVRVYRVLQAGVNQALRDEMAQLQSQQVLYVGRRARRRFGGAMTYVSNCR